MFLQTTASCREQRCVFWITFNVSVIRVTCSSNGEWVVGQSMVCLQQSPESSDEADAFVECGSAPKVTLAGCGEATYLCAHPKVGGVNSLCMVGDVRHCYGAQRVGSAHVTHVRITLSSGTLQAHGAAGFSVDGLGHNYSYRRHLLRPVQAVRRKATRVAHPS